MYAYPRWQVLATSPFACNHQLGLGMTDSQPYVIAEGHHRPKEFSQFLQAIANKDYVVREQKEPHLGCNWKQR